MHKYFSGLILIVSLFFLFIPMQTHAQGAAFMCSDFTEKHHEIASKYLSENYPELTVDYKSHRSIGVCVNMLVLDTEFLVKDVSGAIVGKIIIDGNTQQIQMEFEKGYYEISSFLKENKNIYILVVSLIIFIFTLYNIILLIRKKRK